MSSPEVRRNIMILSLCVALSASAMSLIFTVAAVIGFSLASDKSLSTLPVAFMMIAMMAMTAPSAVIMAKMGRKFGFWMGATIAMLGAVSGMGAVYYSNFWLLCIACACIGAGNAVAMQYRFAAAEAAPVTKSAKPVIQVK
jgi:MFS family permease